MKKKSQLTVKENATLRGGIELEALVSGFLSW